LFPELGAAPSATQTDNPTIANECAALYENLVELIDKKRSVEIATSPTSDDVIHSSTNMRLIFFYRSSFAFTDQRHLNRSGFAFAPITLSRVGSAEGPAKTPFEKPF
jgi:hypothetical protein